MPFICDVRTTFLLAREVYAVLFFIADWGSFDCNDPADDYTCHGGRYYRKLWTDWKDAYDKCEKDGTQLAIAYSTKDLDTLKGITRGNGNGKLGALQCNKLKVEM